VCRIHVALPVAGSGHSAGTAFSDHGNLKASRCRRSSSTTAGCSQAGSTHSPRHLRRAHALACTPAASPSRSEEREHHALRGWRRNAGGAHGLRPRPRCKRRKCRQLTTLSPPRSMTETLPGAIMGTPATWRPEAILKETPYSPHRYLRVGHRSLTQLGHGTSSLAGAHTRCRSIRRAHRPAHLHSLIHVSEP